LGKHSVAEQQVISRVIELIQIEDCAVEEIKISYN